MTSAAPASTSPAASAAATRFLLELENTCSILRVYGQEHPAFRRSADAAAASSVSPIHISVSSRGLAVDKTPVDEPNLARLARLLRTFGLIGLDVEGRLTAAQVTSLVLALDELERAPQSTSAVMDRIARASGGAMRAIPLKLDHLRLVEGTAGKAPAVPGSKSAPADVGSVWRELFSPSAAPAAGAGAGAGPGATSAQSARQLAQSLERAVGASPSPAQWDAMVQGWMKQLTQAGISPSALPALAAAATATAAAQRVGSPRQAEPIGGGNDERDAGTVA